ncbi:bifunctional DNA primase/polymerase [Streptomyces scopuliridis]|uniref:bifunctional DNA primase/polymerase n=1 Tax=Streptomyces scopuliridis TaxID=452529 RepID=UPI0036B93FAC
MTTTSMDPQGVARRCAAQGFPVFPLAPGGKTPLPGCPRCRRGSRAYEPHDAAQCRCLRRGAWCHGFYAATLDAELIRRWWPGPGRGVAVATGPARLLVLDVDRHPGAVPGADRILPGRLVTPAQAAGVRDGLDVLRLLAGQCGQSDPAQGTATLTVRTPSNGLHLWFRAPARTSWSCSAGGDHLGRSLGWQLDVRASGGYIVAPGTRTTAGTYTVLGPEQHPQLLPTWLAGELTRTGHLHDTPASPERSDPPVPNRAAAARAAAAPSGHTGTGGGAWAQRTADTVLAQVLDCGRALEGTGWSAVVNRAAFTFGGLVAGGHISEAAAHTALLDAALTARPHRRSAALGIIRSGLTAGARRALHPRDER